jgi:hypothetical protein
VKQRERKRERERERKKEREFGDLNTIPVKVSVVWAVILPVSHYAPKLVAFPSPKPLTA